jgi:hypothetical protein
MADNEKICIEFVRYYSKDVHMFCASNGFAPTLEGFEHGHYEDNIEAQVTYMLGQSFPKPLLWLEALPRSDLSWLRIFTPVIIIQVLH